MVHSDVCWKWIGWIIICRSECWTQSWSILSCSKDQVIFQLVYIFKCYISLIYELQKIFCNVLLDLPKSKLASVGDRLFQWYDLVYWPSIHTVVTRFCTLPDIVVRNVILRTTVNEMSQSNDLSCLLHQFACRRRLYPSKSTHNIGYLAVCTTLTSRIEMVLTF